MQKRISYFEIRIGVLLYLRKDLVLITDKRSNDLGIDGRGEGVVCRTVNLLRIVYQLTPPTLHLYTKEETTFDGPFRRF